MRGAEARADGEGAVGELVRVQLAEHDRARRPEPLDGERVPRSRRGVLEHEGMRCGDGSGDVDDVLDRDGDTPERALGVRRRGESVCLGERLLGPDGDVRIDIAVELLDAIEVALDGFARGELSALEPRCERGDHRSASGR